MDDDHEHDSGEIARTTLVAREPDCRYTTRRRSTTKSALPVPRLATLSSFLSSAYAATVVTTPLVLCLMMTTLQMTDVVAVVTTHSPSVPREVEGGKPVTETFFTFAWSRNTMAEIRVLFTGLFATAVVARAMSVMELDPWHIPTPVTMSNQGVLSLLILVVRTIWFWFWFTFSRRT